MQFTGLLVFVILSSAGVHADGNATDSKRTSRQDLLIDDLYNFIDPVFWPSRAFFYYRNFPWLSGKKTYSVINEVNRVISFYLAYVPKDAPESFAAFKSNYAGKNF